LPAPILPCDPFFLNYTEDGHSKLLQNVGNQSKWSYLIRLESLLHIYSEETTTQM